MMEDRTLAKFLAQQHADGMAFVAESDLVALRALDGPPPQHYLASFSCKGLVRGGDGAITEADRFVVGIWFPDDYVRAVNPFAVLTLIDPIEAFHPNIGVPFICVGSIAPSTPLVDLLYRVFEVLSYQQVTMAEDNAFNREACAWARRNQQRFPIDPRPLKRRAAALDLMTLAEGTRP